MENMIETAESVEPQLDIASLLESRSGINDSVNAILNTFKQCSERQVMQTLVNFLVDTMITTKKVNLGDFDVKDFSLIAERVNSFYVPATLIGPKFEKFHKVICTLCKEASRTNSIFWYQGITEFLIELSKHNSLEAVVAKMSLSILIVLNDIRIQMKIETLPEQERATEMQNHDYIFNCCLKLFDVAIKGVRYKVITQSITNELFCLIETWSDYYTKNAKCLKLYLECFAVVELNTSLRAILSVNKILNDPNLNEETRKIFIDSIVKKNFINTIRSLIYSASVKLAINAFEAIILLHDYVAKIPSWEPTDYDILFAKTFHKNSSIRKVAAKFYLKSISGNCTRDEEIFLSILEFYFIYQKNADMLDNYVDAFWEYPYLKSFTKILALARSEGFSISAMAHTIIAVVKKMNIEFYAYEDEILKLLKKLPLLFDLLKDELTSYGSLLDIFHHVDLNLYSTINQKYFLRLLTALKQKFENTDNYKLLENLFYIFVKFNNTDLKQFTNEYAEIVETTCDAFLEILSEWEARNFDVEDIDLNVLAGCLFRVSAVVHYCSSLDEQVEDQIISRLKEILLDENQFRKLPETEEFKDTIEAVAIKLNTDLFLRKIQRLLMQTDSNLIEMVTLAKSLSDLMKLAVNGIIREERTLFFEHYVFVSLIRCILISNRSFTNSASQEIRSINVELSKESYQIITNFVVEVLKSKPHEKARSVLIMKRKIIKAYIKLHTEYIGLPLSVTTSNVIVYLSVNDEFKNELRNLIVSLLQYRCSNEENGSRFAKIFSGVLFRLWKIKRHENILKNYIRIFQSKLKTTEYNEIITGSILNMFDMVEKFLIVVEPQPKPYENRLRSLKVLCPLLSILSPSFLSRIVENSKRLAPINSDKIEIQTLKELQRFCTSGNL